MSAAQLVAAMLCGACREWLEPLAEERPRRPWLRVVAYDSGIPSSEGVLNWGDVVDGEYDLWAVAEGRV